MIQLHSVKDKSSFAWGELFDFSVEAQLSEFHKAAGRIQAGDVKAGFRRFSANLFEQGLIDIKDYTSIFGGHALSSLSLSESGGFYHIDSGADASGLAGVYSRAKYGSMSDIRYLAQLVVDYLSIELDTYGSHWLTLFQNAKRDGDSIVLMTTGLRNVPAAANIIYDIVVEDINVKLAHMSLPTIINIKLPRIAPPCENYASLSTEERERVNLTQDHVIPGDNFYRWSDVHVIFGDDVLITGATADKVLYESMNSGAKSFQAIYPVAIDPSIGLKDASVEDRLNRVVIKETLDDELASIINRAGYQPILRTLRVLFSSSNSADFEGFIPKVENEIWLKLYKAALGNDFLRQEKYTSSLVKLKDHLIKNSFI